MRKKINEQRILSTKKPVSAQDNEVNDYKSGFIELLGSQIFKNLSIYHTSLKLDYKKFI